MNTEALDSKIQAAMDSLKDLSNAAFAAGNQDIMFAANAAANKLSDASHEMVMARKRLQRYHRLVERPAVSSTDGGAP